MFVFTMMVVKDQILLGVLLGEYEVSRCVQSACLVGRLLYLLRRR